MPTIAQKSVTILAARPFPRSGMVEVLVGGDEAGRGCVFFPDDDPIQIPLEQMLTLFMRYARANGIALPQAIGRTLSITVTVT